VPTISSYPVKDFEDLRTSKGNIVVMFETADSVNLSSNVEFASSVV